jgi:hypothetical protein
MASDEDKPESQPFQIIIDFSNSVDASSLPDCGAYCQAIKDKLNELCRAMAWPPGHPVLIQKPDGTLCTCKCNV